MEANGHGLANGAGGARPDASSLRLLLAHGDGWLSLLNGLGDPSKDATAGGLEFEPDRYGYQDLRRLRLDPLCRRYVEQPIEAMFRKGVEVETGEKRLNSAVEMALKQSKVLASVQQAIDFRDTFGGGAVLLGFLDGYNPSVAVPPGARLGWTRPLDPQEVRVAPHDWDLDPFSPTYGEPRMWTVYLRTGGQLYVHPSRMLAFPGLTVANEDRRRLAGWGYSDLATFVPTSADLWQIFRGLRRGLAKVGVSVLKMKGLADLLDEDGAEDGAKAIQIRTQAQNRSIATGGMVLVDGELEDYQPVSATLTGYDTAVDRWMMLCASLSRRPVSVFWGRSAGGMSGDNEKELRGWYDDVEGRRAPQVDPALHYVVGRVLDSLSEGGAWQGEHQISWPSLWTPTAKEIEETKAARSERLGKEVDRGIITPEQAALALHGAEDSEVDLQLDEQESMADAPPMPARAA